MAVKITRVPAADGEIDITITISYADGKGGQRFMINTDEAFDLMYELAKYLGAKPPEMAE